MRKFLPGCKTDYKKSTLRIVSKIKEMYKDGKFQFHFEGWSRITDMLRAQFTVENAKGVRQILEKFKSNKNAKIIRIKPRFGKSNNNLNTLILNFNYKDQMICELKVKLSVDKSSLLQQGNKLIY